MPSSPSRTHNDEQPGTPPRVAEAPAKPGPRSPVTFLGAPELEHGTGETYVERNKDTRDREEAKPRSRLESSSHSPPRSKTLSDFSPT